MAPVQTHPDQYLKRMAKGIYDKLFFLEIEDLVNDIDVYIDYGCADGTLLEGIAISRPDAILIGFDEDEQYLDVARYKLDVYGRNRVIRFTSNWNEIVEKMFYYQDQGKKVAIILSSVLHELHSFLGFKDLYEEYDNICLGADYIIIRDMGINSDRRTENVPQELLSKIVKKADLERLRSFSTKYHRISTLETFVHFLLKYPYKDNWVREMQEDYMIFIDHLWDEIEERGYNIEWSSEYTHPWVKKRVKDEFGIDLTYPTHFKLVAKRKD